MKKTIVVIAFFIVGITSQGIYGQSLEESEVELIRLEIQLKNLDKESKKLNSKKVQLENSPEKFSVINYNSLSDEEFLAAAAGNYSLFKSRKSSIMSQGARYIIFHPKRNILVLADFVEMKGNSVIFKEGGTELKLKRNSFDFYEYSTVVHYLPKKSENPSETYLKEKEKIEKRIAEIKGEMSFINEEIVNVKSEIEVKRVEENALILNLVAKSKFKPNMKIYSKLLNGVVGNTGRAKLVDNKLCFQSYGPCITLNELTKEYYTESEFKYAFSKKYGSSNHELINVRILRIGAPSIILRYIYGNPDDINKSTGTWGVHEQWVYNSYDTYVYVENGKISSWQD